jgi:predicted nucleic acid-binding protein
MIVLDTNVVSEMLKPEFSLRVANWVRSRPANELFTTAVNEAEILYGIAIMPQGLKRTRLAAEVSGIFQELFADRVLSFDSRAAQAYADIFSSRRARGRAISQPDAQIAAIALTHNAVIATRNTADFEDCGLRVLNPWLA